MKTCHRLSAAVLTCTLAGLLAPVLLADRAYAASTVLSDVPLAAAKRPNPNLILAMDDSGSMDFEVGANVAEGVFWWNPTEGRFHGRKQDDCLDYVSKGTWGGTGSLNFNNGGSMGQQASGCTSGLTPPASGNNVAPTYDAAGTKYNWLMYSYLFPNGHCGDPGPGTTTLPAPPCDARIYNDGGIIPLAATQQFAFTRSSTYNRMYYNPAVTYLPWKAYNDGTTNCPSGTYASPICTPGNASTTMTMSHPVYGSATSGSSMNLFATYATPVDGSSNPVGSYIFRMQPGMLMPAAPVTATPTGTTKFRLCSNSSGCGGWLAPGAAPWTTSTSNACLILAPITSCANTMGMPSGLNIDMNAKPTGYSVNKPYDYVEAAITYTPGTYWKLDPTTCGTMAAPVASNLANGTCAYGPDGLLLSRVDLRAAAGPFTVPAGRTDCAGGTSCTLAEERQNFANWFQYYRKRTLMMNAALGNAFDGLHGLRAGFFTFSNAIAWSGMTSISNPSGITYPIQPLSIVTMYDFDATTGSPAVADPTKNSSRAIGALYRVTGRDFAGTKTRTAIDYLGQEYRRGSSDAGAPITNYCQFNAGFVITDGFANGVLAPTSVGNYDNNAPSTTYPYNKQYSTTGATIIPPYADNQSNSMADIAMKLYTENPRPDLVPLGGVSVDKADVTPGADRNPNLHVNMYGMVLNLTGMYFGNPAYANQNNDPYTYPPNWNALKDVTTVSGRPEAIDELWHATINGRGQMLLASSPEDTRDAILTIVANVVSKGGAAAAVAVSNPNPVAGDNFAYASNYNSGAWSGDINAYTLDLTTGQPSTTPNWNPSPQHLLAGRDYTTRVIATYNGTAGVPFQWSSLSTTQQGQLGTSVTGPDVLSFLRGNRTKEGVTFRGRGPRAPYPNNVVSDNVAVLGDIVNAEPIYIGAPRFSYMDSGYAAFKTGAAATRTKTVYQGANDGMLHAFDATTGAESWAYIPNAVFPNLANLSSKNAFVHKFYVDGTPVYGDMDFSNTSGSSTTTPDWHTVLVGAYANGGRGYYALDVTSPTMAGESGLASKVLWEFPNAATAAQDNANMGYSFGRAILVKTRAAGWVVLAASGYNNNALIGSATGDGKGHLFVLNAKNGTKIADLSTNNGSTATPSGLAYISAWVDHANTDNTVEAVYGGDLTGQLWRFDLSGSTTASWAVQLVTKLVDGSGNAQPVTTEPELGVVSGYRMIYVGTGEYLGAVDIPLATGALASATSTQTMYALKEPKPYAATGAPLTTALIPTLRGTLQAQVATNPTSTTASVTSNAVNLASKNGWYIDLPHVGERIITNPALGQGTLGFTTNIPDGTDPCLPGGSSWLFNVSYSTGGYIANSNPTAGIAGNRLGSALASRPQFIQLEGNGTPGSAKTVELIRLSNDSTVPANVPLASSGFGGRRKSWREINVQ